jgi:phospholipid/cholesterol/gamma-HCH transport system substrate-binding protein
MKFKIRYSEQIVGLLAVIAVISLVFVVFMLGRTQRWFSRNYVYKTYAAGALGLSPNMPVTCRGIAIGNVKSFVLTDDNRVEVIFTIQDLYNDRVKEGSLVEVVVNPIGLAGQFNFYPGNGDPLEEGAIVPMRDWPEAKAYLASGLAYIPAKEDPISDIFEQATEMIGIILKLFEDLAVGPNARAETALGQTLVNIEHMTKNLASDLADPNGIRRILNGDSEAMNAIEATLISLSGTLDSVDKAMRYIPREMPQIINLLSEARTAVKTAEDVLIALRNNPLLRNGIPAHAEIDSSGTNPRNVRF